MNKAVFIIFLLVTYLFSIRKSGYAQGLHFSQYYNTPTFLNPANTALMPQSNYRVGVNYRNQWTTVPSGYRTMDAFGEFQVFKNEERHNWLGIGAGFYSDKAGNGDLALNKFQVSAAYHLQLDDRNMISVGLYGAYNQRSVNFAKLSFDNQWDGFSFNPANATGENGYSQQTTFFDVGAGINYAFFPNEDLYLKIGGGVQHINRPTESFYGYDNKVGLRPVGNADLMYKASANLIINPSIYASYQKGANELVFGSQTNLNVTPIDKETPTILILGAYYRLNESIIPVLGIEWKNTRLTASYDITLSQASTMTSGAGGFELSIIYNGFYKGNSRSGTNTAGYACPRF